MEERHFEVGLVLFRIFLSTNIFGYCFCYFNVVKLSLLQQMLVISESGHISIKLLYTARLFTRQVQSKSSNTKQSQHKQNDRPQHTKQ